MTDQQAAGDQRPMLSHDGAPIEYRDLPGGLVAVYVLTGRRSMTHTTTRTNRVTTSTRLPAPTDRTAAA